MPSFINVSNSYTNLSLPRKHSADPGSTARILSKSREVFNKGIPVLLPLNAQSHTQRIHKLAPSSILNSDFFLL